MLVSAAVQRPLSRLRLALLAALATLAATAPAQAQVQRSFVNLGFEQPDLGTTACYGNFVGPQQVAGWNTTHGARSTLGGCGVTANPSFGPIIEMWANSFSGVPARAGKQHAELNAEQSSRIYQNVCLNTNEVIRWRLSHRGRGSAAFPDVMRFGLNPQGSTATAVSSVVATIGTTSNGTDRTNTSGTPVPSSASQGSIVIGGTSNGWRDYSGTFTYSGTTGIQQIGFAAVSSGGGNDTVGNFLDEIQVTLSPYIEFDAAAYSMREGGTPSLPRLRVIGTVPAGGIVVPVEVTGGTATLGSDFTLGGGNVANVAIPAGTYDNATFEVPLSVLDDSLIEDNETVVLSARENADAYTLTSTTACSPTSQGQRSATLTILDNDVDLSVTKDVDNATPAGGGDVVFTVVYANNTARPTVADLTAHDAVARIRDAVPTGLTFTAWTCQASGTTCPAASGSGPIDTDVSLPAGNGAAGASVTYRITARLGEGQCSEIANLATLAANAPLAEGASAQAGFVTPTPGGSANNSASRSVDARCASLSLTKSDGSPTYTPGGQAEYVLAACNAGPDSAEGASVRDELPRGVRLSGPWRCQPAAGSGASCPASGGAAGDAVVQLNGAVLPANSCVNLTVPVRFSTEAGDY